MKRLLPISALLLASFPALAGVNVVASTSSMGVLARSVGGSSVTVTVLAPPDRDAHMLQARPNMMIALRNAELLVLVGAELEVGWLPAALQGANNGKILPGTRGYFEAAAQVPLIEGGRAADRSQGDVHPMGNPHVYMDPVRMAEIADSLAGRLGSLDPPNAAKYRENALGFRKILDARLPVWKQKAANSKGIVAFHKDVNYLAALLGVPILGYVEPMPGVPPTAAHLKELIGRLSGQKGVILYTEYQPGQGPDFLARNLNWPKVRLPLEPAVDASAEDYFKLIDRWVDGIASVK